MASRDNTRADPPAPLWPVRMEEERRRFATTRWSVVERAGAPDGGEALSALCQAYWYPVYSFIRGYGLKAEDAADATQGFFEQLLLRNDIAGVDPTKGQFRSWLRACARNYVSNWYAHKGRIKAGGRAAHVSIDAIAAEARFRLEATDQLTPERLFDRRWALTVLERALARLRADYETAGKVASFESLQATLSGEVGDATDSELSVLLGKSAGAIKVERHRFRRRFRVCLRAEVCKTISASERVEDEIRRLIDALS